MGKSQVAFLIGSFSFWDDDQAFSKAQNMRHSLSGVRPSTVVISRRFFWPVSAGPEGEDSYLISSISGGDILRIERDERVVSV